MAYALASAEELLDCLTPVGPLPTPASLLAPPTPLHARSADKPQPSDGAVAFWRLLFLVLVAVAWRPPPTLPHPAPLDAARAQALLEPALFDAATGRCALSRALAEELGVDSDEFGALCRAFLDDGIDDGNT